MVDYWGKFVKDAEKVVRDANGILKNNYETLAKNVENEARRMKERIDCLNRLREMENQVQQKETTAVPILDEKKKQFLELMETIHKLIDSLQNINTLCNPIIGEPHVNPGAHEIDVSNLNSNREILRDQINAFRQLVANETDEFTSHLTFLSQMDNILQGRILRTICLELQNIIDRGDSEKVKQYGSLAGSLLQQIDGFIMALDWELRNVDGESQLMQSQETEGTSGNNNTLS
uniref:Uncharacterized protein n=1 Tax=Caenorhabditis tropicalis TaxID=1561998 RepID=A0A1I7TFG5_9PELO